MAKELRNIDVRFVSLVKKGANRKHIIVKSPDFKDGEATFSRLIRIEKIDEPKRMVYGLVYSPNSPEAPDTDDEFVTVEEIEKACERFMRQGLTPNVDVAHSWEREDGAFIKESWIVKSADPLFPDEVGAWAVGIKVEKDDLWKQVESGDIGGLSLGGFAEKFETEKSDKGEQMKTQDQENLSFMAKVGEAIRSVVQKESASFEQVVDYRQFWDLWYALESACCQAINDEELDHGQRMAKIAENIEQFKKAFAGLKVEKVDASVIEKEGKVFSKANYEKLIGVMDTLQKLVAGANTEKSTKEEKQMDLEKLVTELSARVEKLEKVETPPAAPPAGEPSEVEKSLKTLTDRIEKLEKPAVPGTPAVAPEVEGLQKTVKTITDRLEKLEKPPVEAGKTEKSAEVQAIEKSLTDLAARLETVEKARGISHKAEVDDPPAKIEKTALTGQVTPRVKRFGQ